MSFLPQDYTAPRSSNNYVKLIEGENKFRILSKPILGWEDWKDNKPIRFAYDKKPLKSIDPKKPVKHFWAFIVWSYDMEMIQIFSITQASIRSNLEALCKDKDWGDPYFYDIKIIKTGQGVDTEYKVNPLPHKPVSKEVMQAFKDKKCYLDAHLDCLDAFAPEWPNSTPGIFSKGDLTVSIGTGVITPSKPNKDDPFDGKDPFGDDDEKIEPLFVSGKDLENLKASFGMCSMEYRSKFMQKLSKLNPPVLNLEKIPVDMYPRIQDALNKESYEQQLRMTGEPDAA